MSTLGWALGTIAGVLLIAGLRAASETVLHSALGLPAQLLDTGRSGAAGAAGYVRGVAATARRSLAYGAGGPAQTWDIAAPLVYLVLFALIAVGDLVLAGLRFGALLGIPVDGLPLDGAALDMLAGLLFLAVLATFGCVLLDVLHITPLQRPYGLVVGSARKLVMGAAAGGTALSVIAAVLFFVWGQDAISGNPSNDLATLFIATFAVALVGASILAAGGAVGAVPAVWALLCALCATALMCCAWVLELVVVVLDGLYRTAVAVIRLAARPGTTLWNWIGSLGVGSSMRLTSLPDPGPIEGLLTRSVPGSVALRPISTPPGIPRHARQYPVSGGHRRLAGPSPRRPRRAGSGGRS